MENEFSQVCVWPGTIVGEERINYFVEIMQKDFGIRVKYLKEIKTAPDYKNGHPIEGTGGRNDLFFAIHNDDVMKFAIPRLSMGIRWIEDVLDNEGDMSIYPENVKEYRTW